LQCKTLILGLLAREIEEEAIHDRYRTTKAGLNASQERLPDEAESWLEGATHPGCVSLSLLTSRCYTVSNWLARERLDVERVTLNRIGLATLSDLKTEEWGELFPRLERAQEGFLRRDQAFRSAEYTWPRDALHNWSRVWEYPYTLFHLERWRRSATPRDGRRPNVVDLGSGVTFFPFLVTGLDVDVTCLDVDPVCERDLAEAATVVPHGPGSLVAKLSLDGRLPFDDCSVDALYCISVLEHIPDFTLTLEEIRRVLVPDGLLILTIDLDLRGDQELGVDARSRLRQYLFRHFASAAPETSVHPGDILHSLSGPYPMPPPTFRQRVITWTIDQLLKRLPQAKVPYPPPARLACEGYVMRKSKQ